MAIQTGSTNISESMTDIIKIPTVNLRFSTTASSNKMVLGDSSNDRQPEIVTDAGNTYSSETVKATIKIPTISLGFTTTES